MRKPVFALALVGSAALAACSQPAPTQQDVSSYIVSRLPVTLKLADLLVKSFPGQQGAGRASVAGSLVITEDLYERSQRTINTALAEKGLSQDEIAYANRLGGNRYSVYEISETKGKSIPFSGELSYLSTASGIALSGGIRYQRPQGVLIANLGQGSLIAYSPNEASIISNLSNAVGKRSSLVQARKQQAAALLSGKTYKADALYTRRDDSDWARKDKEWKAENDFTLTLGKTVNWDDSGISSSDFNFAIDGNAIFHQDGGNWANEYYHRGEKVPMRIYGTVQIPYSGDARLIITPQVPDRVSFKDGRFYSTGTRLMYDGKRFTWTHTCDCYYIYLTMQ